MCFDICAINIRVSIRVRGLHLGIKQVGMSQSATPATQNDMTTCLETFEKESFAASPIDTRCHRKTRDSRRHVGAAKRACRARLAPILTLSTRYQTGWNVTKCNACHAKRHDNLLGNLRKGEVLQLPHRHGDATGKPETRDETRGRSKTSMSCETSANFDTLGTLSTGWNVTKCNACHAKRHDNLLGNLRKGEVLQLHP